MLGKPYYKEVIHDLGIEPEPINLPYIKNRIDKGFDSIKEMLEKAGDISPVLPRNVTEKLAKKTLPKPTI